MPERIARHRIIIGKKKGERVVIQPGTRFNTDDHGISAAELRGWDSTGAVRKLRDQTTPAAPAGPREQSETGQVVEGRSGPVSGDATSGLSAGMNQTTDGDGESAASGDEGDTSTDRRTTRRRRSDENYEDL